VVRVKICGIGDLATASAAADAGATAIGLIFAPESRRRVAPEAAAEICRGLPPFIARVGVVVNESLDGVRALIEQVGVDTIQLHGDETPEFCDQVRALGAKVIKALSVSGPIDLDLVRAYPVSAVLLDTHRAGQRGGTGETFDWAYARPVAAAVPVILSGGLSPENVAAGIDAVRPYGVDVSSGVETQGVKDPKKIRAFIAAARAAGRAGDAARAGTGRSPDPRLADPYFREVQRERDLRRY
jgi:phosphoribosylanthranilate isomerase